MNIDPCKRCGGGHYGARCCPFLDEASCVLCGHTIEAEAGSDSDVHPHREFGPFGHAFHPNCVMFGQQQGRPSAPQAPPT